MFLGKENGQINCFNKKQFIQKAKKELKIFM